MYVFQLINQPFSFQIQIDEKNGDKRKKINWKEFKSRKSELIALRQRQIQLYDDWLAEKEIYEARQKVLARSSPVELKTGEGAWRGRRAQELAEVNHKWLVCSQLVINDSWLLKIANNDFEESRHDLLPFRRRHFFISRLELSDLLVERVFSDKNLRIPNSSRFFEVLKYNLSVN